jgi:fatty-acyl-CoA synthase
VLAAVSHASTMVILEDFDPSSHGLGGAGEMHRLYGVPTMFISILEHKLFSKFDYGSLRTGIMAGSPCPVKSMEDVMQKMNMTEVTICYGLTEASPVITQTQPSDDVRRRTQTVGRAMPASRSG